MSGEDEEDTFHIKHKIINHAPDTSEGNRTELLAAFPKEEVSTNGQREIRKNLGVYWKKDENILTFKPPPNLNTQSRSTMRQMLSHAARVYDLLGAHSTVYWPDETVVSALVDNSTGLGYTITTKDRKTMA
ncbi:hypothetical protein T09_13496 [Trichinella sp. T9]|nr:hypothetical protein T09_13496 [Trichinella sp. T9]